MPNDPLWTAFHAKYPDSGGFLKVSAVGFDPARRRAMVYIAHSCGALCGGGRSQLLEKIDGTWRQARIPGVTDCTIIS